jgi:membrane fusion protein, multidrug efflux system
MHKKILVIGVVVVLAAGGYLLLRGNSGEDGQNAAAPQPVDVAVVTLRPQQVRFSQVLPGRTTAYKVAEIRPQVSGIIIERSFTEGDNVTEGQQLYQIDPAPYQAAYESARAALQRAEANVRSVQSRSRRYAELVEVDAVSRQEYDDIRAELAQARADVAVASADVTQAKINLDYTKVYSPISGRIGKSAVTEGALVTANQSAILTKVTQLDPIYVDMTQSSTELMQLRQQMGDVNRLPVRLKIENNVEYEHSGHLQFSDITVDESTGSVQLRALFPNPELVLLPGLFVRSELTIAQQEALLIPQQAAIRDAQGNLSAWVVGADDTVNPRPINVLRAYEDKWVISDGLEAGDVVVTEGFQKIQPGVAVNPAPADMADEQVPEQPEEAAASMQEQDEAVAASPTGAPMPAGEEAAEQAATSQDQTEDPNAE